MRKRSRKERDVNELAHAMAEAIAAGEMPRTADGKNPIAVALGRMGGLKGGRARAANMSAKERSDSARKAAAARWQQERGNNDTAK
jgi:hypothetical protein